MPTEQGVSDSQNAMRYLIVEKDLPGESGTLGLGSPPSWQMPVRVSNDVLCTIFRWAFLMESEIDYAGLDVEVVIVISDKTGGLSYRLCRRNK